MMAASITGPCPHLCHTDWRSPCSHEHGWQDCPGCHAARERIKAIVVEAQARRDAITPPSTCTCRELMLNGGKGASGVRNWCEACPEHGVDSDWYRSPEQVAKRAADRERLIGLQEQARQARAAARESHT